MARYTLDCSRIADSAALHQALAELLSLPEWYGRNLDALYDCLTELGADTCLHLLHEELLVQALGPTYAAAFRQTLLDAQAHGRHFTLE